MEKRCFKFRKFLDFSPHPNDIGNPIGFWYKYDDNHFLQKTYRFHEEQFELYYNYHLAYALERKICSKENFFLKIWHIVKNRISFHKNQDPFSSSHLTHVHCIDKLQQFQKYLNSKA